MNNGLGEFRLGIGAQFDAHFHADETSTDLRPDASPHSPAPSGQAAIAAPYAQVGRRKNKSRASVIENRASATQQKPRPATKSRLGTIWLVACLALAGVLGLRPPPASDRAHIATTASALPDSPKHASRRIEEIRVGQRVLGKNPDLAQWEHTTATEVDAATWRLVRLHAEGRWEDGTLDTVEVETLQPLLWIEASGARIGRSVPIPCDLEELALPLDMRGTVTAIEPCPELEQGPGHLVLLTVNHLSDTVYDLTVTDSAEYREAIGVTAIHRFYSDTRRDWVAAAELRVGEQLRGIRGALMVERLTRRPGVHRVYNMTIEGEHVYHVASTGVLVHNTCPGGPFNADQQALVELVNEASLNGHKPLDAATANNVLDWAQEVGIPGRASPGDIGIGVPSNWIGEPHIHIGRAGRGGHVPVGPGVTPR